MSSEIQVDRTHYRFETYVTKKRWASIWHQLDECISLSPDSVLEVGPGTGIFKAMMRIAGFQVETVDFAPALKPDYVADCKALPFADNAFDVTCAFQMLEHLPFDESVIAFNEMARVSRSHVLISLPDSRTLWTSTIHVPGIGRLHVPIPRPRLIAPKHHFDGEHYWEIGKRGYSLREVCGAFCRSDLVQLFRNFRVRENPYHHFMLFAKHSS